MNCGTLLLESGIPINNVSELLGHASSVVTAMGYSHTTNAGMERVTSATAADDVGVSNLQTLMRHQNIATTQKHYIRSEARKLWQSLREKRTDSA